MVGALGLTMLSAGCASQAEREAELAKRQRLVETQVQLGASYLQRGQLDVAKEYLEKAVEADPDSAQANNMMALLQWRLKQYDEADRYFRRAINANVPLPEAENNYGVFLCDRGKTEDALRLFDKVAANPLYKTPAAALENAGMCLMRKPAPLAAEKHFRKALEVNPNQARSLLQMARISYDRGNALAARGFIQRYFQVAEDTAESLLLAARIERALKSRDAEASYVVRLRGKFPTSDEAQQLASESTPPSPPVNKPKP